MKSRRLRGTLVIGLALAPVLGACSSGPTVGDAEEYLEKGDAESALRAAREAAKGRLEPELLNRARRVAFEAGILLGRSDEAALELQELRVPPVEREKLTERLAGTALGAALVSPDAGRRAIAASELALAAGHPKLLGLIEAALADREPGVRCAAVAAAARLSDTTTSVTRLARIVTEDSSPEVRDAATQALTQRLGRLRDHEPDDITRARAVLARVPAPVTLPAAFGLESSDRELKSGIEAPDYETRLASVRALAARRRSHAGGLGPWVGRLIALVHDDPAAPVRAAAIDALALDREQAPLLMDMSRTHEDPATRRRAFLAADRARPETTAELGETLDTGDPAVAPDAARLLGERGGTAALAPLVKALATGRDESVAAAHALGVVGGVDAAAALVRVLDSPNGELRRAAAEGLARAGSLTNREDLARAIARVEADGDLAAAAALLAACARSGGAAGATPQEAP